MKSSNSKEQNLAYLDLWYKDAGYLVRKFGSVLTETNMTLSELSGNHIKFSSKECNILFQYDANRYSSGRTLVDIILEKGEDVYRLSHLVRMHNSAKNIQELVTNGSKNHTAPIDTYKELFYDYLMPVLKHDKKENLGGY